MYKLFEHVIYDVDDESNKHYLINIEKGTLFELNQFASIIIKYINENKSIEEYVNYVKSIAGESISKSLIEADVYEYLNNLESKELIYRE